MKKFLIFFVISSFLFIFSTFALAAQVTISWELSIISDISEIFIYQSNESGVYDYDNPVVTFSGIYKLKTQTIIKDLDKDKVYYWVARCKNSAGIMSIDSNEISTKKPPPPSKLELFKYIP